MIQKESLNFKEVQHVRIEKAEQFFRDMLRHRKRVNIKTVLAGRRLGIKEAGEGIWIVSFMRYDQGFIDGDAENLATNRQPVRPEVVTHVLGTFRYLCLRAGHKAVWRKECPP